MEYKNIEDATLGVGELAEELDNWYLLLYKKFEKK